MALTITEAGKANSTTSSSSLTVTLTASFAVGNTVFAIVAADNSGTNGASSTGAISDSKSNTWTTVRTQNHDPGVVNAGVTLTVFSCDVTTALTTSDTLTVSFSPDTTSKAILVWKVVAPSGYKASINATDGSGGTVTSLNRSLSIGAGNSVIGAQGWATNATVTRDTDTTRGAWSTLHSDVADTGTSSTSITVASQWKNPTGTAFTQGFTTSVASGAPSANVIFELTEVVSVITRTATGSGTGSEYAAIPANPSPNDVTDFQFSFRNTPGFYLGPTVVPRTATGSGTGTESASFLHVAVRTASAQGTSAETATGERIIPRTATATGSSAQTATGQATRTRVASSSAVVSQTATGLHIAPRTATGAGTGGQQVSSFSTRARTAQGTSTTAQVGVGVRVVQRSVTNSGLGTQTVQSVKLLIFRTPADTLAPADWRNGSISNRLFRYAQPTNRGKNIYKLTNGTFTDIDQRNPDVVSRVYYGGTINYVTQAEKDDLIAAGYGEYVT